VPFRLGDRALAVSGVILFPRLGTASEKYRAKQNSGSHVATDRVVHWIQSTREMLKRLQTSERETVSSHLEALHEVRRLNQTVKVVMERVCNRTTSGQPESAEPDFVRAWKASLLISHHLDALDILANPTIQAAVPDKDIVFYKLVDSIYRIYLPRAAEKNVTLSLTGGSYKHARIHSNTIHIAPSAFIDNAIKYSPEKGVVEVHVFEGARENRPTVGFDVISTGPAATEVEELRLFKRRGRALAAKAYGEGSGVGLVTVRMVADQHSAWASARQRRVSAELSEWTFRFEIPATD
jgi:signal transduction histidine kinase